MTTRVALVGASGKLGTVIHRVIDGLDGIEVTHALGSRDTFASLSEVDLVVDATHPVVSAEVVAEAIAARVNVLVATSGWSADRISALRPAVVALITAAGLSILQLVAVNQTTGGLDVFRLAIAAGAFCLLRWKKPSPIFTMIGCGALYLVVGLIAQAMGCPLM